MFEMDLRGEKNYKTGYDDGYEEGVENGIMAERHGHRKSSIIIAVVTGLNIVMGILNVCGALNMCGILSLVW